MRLRFINIYGLALSCDKLCFIGFF